MSDPADRSRSERHEPPFPAHPPPPERRFVGAAARALFGLALLTFLAPPALSWMGKELCPRSHWCGCDSSVGFRWISSHFLPQITGQALFAAGVLFFGREGRGGRGPRLALLAPLALLPLGVGLWQTLRLEREMATQLSLSAADLPILARMVGGGVVERIAALEVSASSAGIAMLAVAVVAASTLFTLDTSKIGPPPGWAVFRGARSDSLSTTRSAEHELRRTTLAWGLIAILIASCTRAVLHTKVLWFDALALTLVGTSVLLAGASGRSIPSFIAHRNPGPAGAAFRTLALCAFACATSAFLLEAPSLGIEVRSPIAEGALVACGGGGVPIYPVRDTSVLPPEVGGRLLLLLVDAVACFAVFVPALLAGARARSKRSLPALGIAPCIALVGLFGLFGEVVFVRTLGHIAALRAPYEMSERAMAQARIELAVSRGGSLDVTYPARWIVATEGSHPRASVVTGNTHSSALRRSEWEGAKDAADVAADGELAIHDLIGALTGQVPPRRGTLSIHLMAAPAKRRMVERFGVLAGLFGTDLASYEIGLNESLGELTWHRLTDPKKAGAETDIGVVPDAGTARLFTFRRPEPRSIAILSMGPSLVLMPSDDAGGSIDAPHADPMAGRYRDRWWDQGERIVVAASGEMTMNQLIAVLDVLGPKLSGVVVTVDRAPFEDALAAFEQSGSSD